MKRAWGTWRGRGPLALGCAALLISGLGGMAPRAKSTAAETAKVKIDNFTFSPETLTVAAGTTVEWTNRDDIPHTVVSEDKKTFKSRALDTDESFSHKFDQPGTYTYFCSIHPKMVGKVIVH